MKHPLINYAFLSIALILLVFQTTFASVPLFPEENDAEYQVALDNLPTPVGGYESIMKKIVYPEMAIKTRVEGKVYILVYIDEAGNVNEAKTVKGIGGGCDEEALRIVRRSKFVPATSRGTIVKAKFAIALSFKLPG
jgi:periplasmic protein TonB